MDGTMLTPSFELFDHTADMGIRVRAATLEGLLEPAARGLYAAIGGLVPAASLDARPIDLTGDDAAGLLRDFLTELLIWFERDGAIATAFEDIRFEDRSLATSCRIHRVDSAASVFAREVKAITYHELEVRAVEGGFEARVIVDI
jgi:SHS2 domain-containing protein